MKIKVLECPIWVQLNDEYTKKNLEYSFTEIKPLFNRNGYYFVENYKGIYRSIIVEYNGKAYSNNEEKSIEVFYWELEKSEYEGINILSKEQSDAIKTLMKINLASKEQKAIYREDYSKRYRKLYNFRWNKKFEELAQEGFADYERIEE